MAATHILSQSDAQRRSELLTVDSYKVELDLTDHKESPTFDSTTTVAFTSSETGADTFIEIAAEEIVSATLNGQAVDTTGYTSKEGLKLSGLAPSNELIVQAKCAYSTSGQGLHRMSDPVDGETYLYTQFEVSDAQQVFACFDQPDLKATFALTVRSPQHWRNISNMPVATEDIDGDVKTTVFEPTPRMSTYIAALCAGPYHEVRETHDGIDLGLYCRESEKASLDPEGVFEITRQGFDFFHEAFGVRYPLPKYDQIFAPEYNFGAMENFGCITIAESAFLFRGQVTDFELEQRANVILHEMAHMWFGDLVTMHWWDDLWLNESFAEWAAHWSNAEATRFKGAWTTFLSARKNWGYRQDQLPTTHPVYTDMPDTAAVATNFDGITYAKGASILKQLVAYVGIEPFKNGLTAYFKQHQFGNAAFSDLLTKLEEACGKPLGEFADTWLKTAGVSTLRPAIEVDAEGKYSKFSVMQETSPDYPTLRTHRIAIGLYDLDGDRLVRRRRIEVDVAGERTEVPELNGIVQPDLLLLNDDDLTYCKLRLDERSLGTAIEHVSKFTESLPRALVWAAAWDMLRDAELPARDFVRLAVSGLPSETDINITTVAHRQVMAALAYADPAVRNQLRADWATAAREALAKTTPGGDLQRAWAKTYASAAIAEDDIAVLKSWLDGNSLPQGLTVDTDLRWHLVTSLAAGGHADEALIDAELENDNTAEGLRLSTIARTALPTAEAKAKAWSRLIEEEGLPNYARRSIMVGFAPLDQEDLVRPYLSKFLEAVPKLWETLDPQQAVEFTKMGFPTNLIEDETLRLVDEWLAAEERPSSMARGVSEGRADVERALAGRELDRKAS
ncbi:aminopeptidase N [Natronoglycomyces albus]|uniref:Aminopeptidase N n=1 Tax=Natronoglycomyces albus TaxID=2811108 RepID=A0A895XUS3_9ACTN|nr:aminopeptidase N [Natronoglycomyces albus]QSB06276.1 aminopeptidase N [Natronoglycomyces albus]